MTMENPTSKPAAAAAKPATPPTHQPPVKKPAAKRKRRTALVASDIDANGNATVWDHGPSAPRNVEAGSDEWKRLEAEAKTWHDLNGKGPIPIVMHSGEAANAIVADPERYTLDPLDADDPDVAAKLKEIREAREASAKASAEHAAKAQDLADLKQAVAAVMAERRAAEVERRAPHDPVSA